MGQGNGDFVGSRDVCDADMEQVPKYTLRLGRQRVSGSHGCSTMWVCWQGKHYDGDHITWPVSVFCSSFHNTSSRAREMLPYISWHD